MRKIVILIALFVVGMLNAQETGSVTGTLLDKEADNQPLPFANVLIKGTTKGTTTDFDGLYTIDNLEPGTYTLEFSFVGYETLDKELVITAGQTTTVNASIGASAAALDEVVIKTTTKKESEAAILLEQKNAVTIQQKIGAQELSKKGVSDVATGLTKATGISKQSDKLYVRGLGDRYNNAYLNGLPIPSLNPKLKLIDLGIFPTDIVENLGIYKTYSPDIYGDFAGASVNIDTKDRPGKGFLEVGFSSGVNTNAVSNDFFLLNGGKYDDWGLDDGSRRVPIFLDIPNYNYVSTDINNFPFDTSFNPEKRFNAPDGSASITGGKTFTVGNEQKLDLLFTGSFGQNHETATAGIESTFNAQGGPISNFSDINRYRYNTNTTVLGSVGYRWNINNKILATTLFVNDTQDELREFRGLGDEDASTRIFARRGTYEQNTLFTQQLTGEHKFKEDKYKLSWGMAYNKAQGLIPDRRQLFFTEIEEGLVVLGDRTSPDFANNQRFYQELDENDYSAKIDFDINFGKNEDDEFKNKLTVGVASRSKDREFEANQLNYNLNNFRNTPVEFNNPDALLNETNFLDGAYVVLENLNPTRIYEADLSTLAAFANLQYALSKTLTFNGGIRTELFEQNVFYREQQDLETSPFRTRKIEETFILPSISFKYEVNNQTNLRFAASKTVTLPKFTEVAPFLDEDVTEVTLGNPIVTNSDNYNVDIKWEHFPEQSGELVAATLFGKYIENPIEKVFVASAANQNTFINSDNAVIFGAELEYKKNLGNLFKVEETTWNDLSFGINATLMYTQVEIDPTITTFNGSNIAPTNLERQLQGASPFLVNADLAYSKEFESHKITSAIDFNIFGDRVYSAGGNGVGDIFEQGYGSLNFNFKDEIGDHIEISFKAKNLLNPDIKRYIDQESIGREITNYNFDNGINFSLGVTFKL
ncbi:TonB-dependent receptor [Aquimarina mytili]|uniref:Carboxypeptidase-like regulatory domain-containing protein n=1 Tax=Aquimarina mytili TaxID=874423 RepID=A0A937D8Z9_9FLAO|nr:TonB-dependent receptor [Aquimarina mytili]MBL0682003.1 carboxypeptidase-like regulatory domain-containing protein [Aquimarina mytili]